MFPISVISQELDTAKAGKPEFLYDLGIKIEPTRESVPPEGGIGVANSGLSTIQAQLDSLYMAINKNKTLKGMMLLFIINMKWLLIILQGQFPVKYHQQVLEMLIIGLDIVTSK